MRGLFHIPIVHTPEDLGSQLEAIRKEYIARYGVPKWHDHVEAVGKFWQEVNETFLNLPVDYARIRLYQDGLPVFGRELELVEKLAEDGNRNYRLLSKLVTKGATVMGTEDAKLLIEERDRIINNGVADSANSYDELMERRDQYIAQRIDTTLNDGEIGLLFIGALHRVVDKLPNDVRICKSVDDLKESNSK